MSAQTKNDIQYQERSNFIKNDVYQDDIMAFLIKNQSIGTADIYRRIENAIGISTPNENNTK